MKHRTFVAIALCLAWCVVLPAAVGAQPEIDETSAYMWVTANGSLIQGPVTEPGKEGSIQLIGYDHMIERPYDPETGLPTGFPIHHPVWIKKQVDQTSPLLYLTLADNQDVDLLIRFYQLNGAGQEVNVYTIQTIEGRTVNVQEFMPDQVDPFNTTDGFHDACAFVYGTIRWTWEEGGVTYQMNWHSTGEVLEQLGSSDNSLALMPPWPNPAHGKTNLKLALPMGTEAKLQIFDLAGRKIRELHDGELKSWRQEFVWDGRNQRNEEVTRGVYQVRLSWKGGTATKSLIWLR